jgi:hypothetical protein
VARRRASGIVTTASVIGGIGALAIAFYLTKPGGGSSAPARPRIAQPARGTERRAAAPAPTASPSQVVRDHGENAVVRAGESVVAQAAALPLATPVWDAPVDLTFSSFKALRRGYREAKAFSPEDVARLHGAAAVVRGALMPIDPIPKSGEMRRFWLANPVVVMAGCVFCFPPTLADLVYVTTDGAPLVVDRERLYRSVEYAKLLGRLRLGPGASDDGVEYMFSMEMKERLE